MSILSDLKSEKSLSFSHWRYRILHWFFNRHPLDVEDAVSQGVPRYFYTHYCPLFHLTNLLLLTSPLIVFFRFMKWAVKQTIDVTSMLKPYLPKRKVSEKTLRRLDVKLIVEFANISSRTFDDAWENLLKDRISILTKDEAQKIWEIYQTKLNVLMEKKEIQQKKTRERTVFWVNFSRVFFKLFFNVLYGGLALLMVYAAWVYGTLLISLIWNFSVLDFLLGFITVCLYGLLFAVFIAGLYLTAGRKVLPILLDAMLGFVSWTHDVTVGVTEFFSVFYEENCPPIKIVSEDEAIMEDMV